MEELYRTMMNHGILIYERESKFVLHKLHISGIQNDTVINSNTPGTLDEIVFNTFEDALESAKKLIKWQEPTIQQHQDCATHWKMEMMYRHKGLGARYAELGELGNTSYDAAVQEANKRAESYISQSGLERDVEGFDIRVRPCRKR